MPDDLDLNLLPLLFDCLVNLLPIFTAVVATDENKASRFPNFSRDLSLYLQQAVAQLRRVHQPERTHYEVIFSNA
jgi:hypothetical protein